MQLRTVQVNFQNGSFGIIANVVRDSYLAVSDTWQFMDHEGHVSNVPVRNIMSFDYSDQDGVEDGRRLMWEEVRRRQEERHDWQDETREWLGLD